MAAVDKEFIEMGIVWDTSSPAQVAAALAATVDKEKMLDTLETRTSLLESESQCLLSYLAFDAGMYSPLHS